MFFDRRRTCRDITLNRRLMLTAVSALAGLYRGSLEWIDVLTAIVGFALLGMAAYEAGREAGRSEIRCS